MMHCRLVQDELFMNRKDRELVYQSSVKHLI